MWTWRARATVALALLFYLIGLINDLSSMYFLTSFVISTGGLCFLLALYSLTGLVFELDLAVDQVFEGEPVCCTLHVRNRARVRKPGFLLRLRLVNATQQSEHQEHFYVDSISSGESVEGSLMITGLRRGAMRIESVAALGCDPLGLFCRRVPLTCERQFTVYPRLLRLPRADPARVEQPVGLAMRRRAPTASGMEFATVRPYTHDDDLRHIHWSSTARLGRLAVRQFQAEGRGTAVVALQLNASYGSVGHEREIEESAVRVAASLASDRCERGEEVALLLLAEEPGSIPFGLGSWHRLRLLDALARARPAQRASDAALGQLPTRFVAALARDTALDLVVAGEPHDPLMRSLRARGIAPRLVRITVATDESAGAAVAMATQSSTLRSPV